MLLEQKIASIEQMLAEQREVMRWMANAIPLYTGIPMPEFFSAAAPVAPPAAAACASTPRPLLPFVGNLVSLLSLPRGRCRFRRLLFEVSQTTL